MTAPAGCGKSVLARQVALRLRGVGLDLHVVEDGDDADVVRLREQGQAGLVTGRQLTRTFGSADEKVFVVDQAMLRLTRDEVADVVAPFGLSDEELDDIVRRTAGWPAGVRWLLAAATGGHVGDLGLDGYLQLECFGELTLDQLDAACALALLAPCPASFAVEFLTHLADPAATVAEVRRRVPAIDIVSTGEPTVVVSPQIAQALVTWLDTHRPGERIRLLDRAARQAEAVLHLERAYCYFLATGDRQSLVRFFYRSTGDPLVQHKDLERVERWLEVFRHDDFIRWPRLAGLQGVVTVFRRSHHELPYWIALAERDDPLADEMGCSSGADLVRPLKVAFTGQTVDQPEIDLTAHAKLSASVVFNMTLKVSRDLRRGDLDRAIVEAYRIAPFCRPYEILEYLRHCLLGIGAVFKDDVAGARRHIDDASVFEARGEKSDVEHIYDVLRCWVLSREPDHSGYEVSARRALERMAVAPDGRQAGGFTSSVILMDAAMWLGDLTTAQAASDVAGVASASDPGATLLHERLRRLRLQLRSAVESNATVFDDLTPTERRVAAMLDSPLRVADIADHLGISVSTVRSHVKAIYRKFGVSDRVQMVERLHDLANTRRSGGDAARTG